MIEAALLLLLNEQNPDIINSQDYYDAVVALTNITEWQNQKD